MIVIINSADSIFVKVSNSSHKKIQRFLICRLFRLLRTGFHGTTFVFLPLKREKTPRIRSFFAGASFIIFYHRAAEFTIYNTKLQLKQDKIQSRQVMLLITSEEMEQMVSQRRSTTLSRVAKTSFRNPLKRISFQICSIGFISGVYGGMWKMDIFSGIFNAFDLCQAAPSQHKRM